MIYESFYVECPYCHAKSKVSCGVRQSFDCPKCGKQFLYDRWKGAARARVAGSLLIFFVLLSVGLIGLFLIEVEEAGKIWQAVVTVVGVSLVLGFFYLLGEKGRKLFGGALEVLGENFLRTFGCIRGIPCENEDKQKNGQKTNESGPTDDC